MAFVYDWIGLFSCQLLKTRFRVRSEKRIQTGIFLYTAGLSFLILGTLGTRNFRHFFYTNSPSQFHRPGRSLSRTVFGTGSINWTKST